VFFAVLLVLQFSSDDFQIHPLACTDQKAFPQGLMRLKTVDAILI
jgi:hypothetical protein